MRPRANSLRVAALLAVVLTARAAADEPSFWEEILHPEVGRYDTLIARAAELLEDGNAPGALPLLLEAEVIAPRDPLGLFLLGWARHRLRIWAACADSLAAVSADELRLTHPELGAPLDDMFGQCLALSGRLDEAVAHYRRLLALPPGGLPRDMLQGRLGDSYQALGRLEEAVVAYGAAIALAPRRALLHAELAMAYDRDERGERARETMARALALDLQMSELTSAAILTFPPLDVHYLLGLAFQLATEHGPHRALAIAHFKKYIELSPSATPWLRRARQHLLELGPSTLRPDDLRATPADASEAPLILKELLALGPELQGCFEADTGAVVRIAVAYHGHGKDAVPTIPTVSLTSVGPARASSQTLECLEKRLLTRKHAVRQMTRIQIAIGAP